MSETISPTAVVVATPAPTSLPVPGTASHPPARADAVVVGQSAHTPAAANQTMPMEVASSLDAADKPVFASLWHAIKTFQGAPKVLVTLLSWYRNFSKAMADADQRLDLRHAHEARSAMLTAWGGDYERRLGRVFGYLDSLPGDVGAALRAAMMPDGKFLLSSAAGLVWLDGLADLAGAREPAAKDPAQERAELRELMGNSGSAYWKGPMSAIHQARYQELSAGKTSTAIAAIDREIAEIRAQMRNLHGPYWKGPQSASMQARFMELVRLKEKK